MMSEQRSALCSSCYFHCLNITV